MTMRTLLIAAALGMLALIAGAFAFDCHRLALQARSRVELADQELRKHEQRLVKVLSVSPALTPDVQFAITIYEGSSQPPLRHTAYDKLVAAFQKTMQAELDPADPLARKFMDDVAGALNRREIAEKSYDAEIAAYHDYMSGLRGAVVNWFSPPAGAQAEEAAR